MRYFDLHCDTATKLYRDSKTLATSERQISLSTIGTFEKYGQVFAIFSNPENSNDKAYQDFFDISSRFKIDNNIEFCTDLLNGKNNCILSVEDARILNGDISRLQKLYDAGVRIMTFLWGGVTCIGGSFDTDDGLTDFGSEVVVKCIELGIIPDISHASRRSADDILSIAESYEAPVIASHSNSYTVNPHPRNITDETARRVASSGGVIGICLHGPHLGYNPNVGTAVDHIEHFINIVGTDAVCLGCDLDGTRELPNGITNQSDIVKIAEEMSQRCHGKFVIEKIFYQNAFEFFKNNLGKKRGK